MSSLKYRREKLHWMEFVGLAHRRSYGDALRLFVWATGAVPILIAMAVDVFWPGWLDQKSVLFGIFMTLLMMPVMGKIGVRRHVRKAGWILGDREITLADEGLVDAGKSAALSVSWPAIEEVSVEKGVIVLWMDAASGIFIPRSAFASPEDETNFVAFAQKHSAAQGGPSRPVHGAQDNAI